MPTCRTVYNDRFSTSRVVHDPLCANAALKENRPPCRDCGDTRPDQHRWNADLLMLTCLRPGGTVQLFERVDKREES